MSQSTSTVNKQSRPAEPGLSDHIVHMALGLCLVSCLAPGLTLANEATGALQGTIVDHNQQPVADATIVLEESGITTTSSSDGGFELASLSPGRHTLLVTAAGFLDQRQTLSLRPGSATTIEIELAPALRAIGEIDVTSSFTLNQSDPVSGVALSREELLELPHFGDDIVRALPLLPAVAGNDESARFSLRGGLYREVGYQLDGVEIYKPFHLEDYQGVFSILDPRLIEQIKLLPGPFPAEHGDRLAGVLDMSTVSPEGPPSGELGLSFTGVWASGMGGFADDRGSWFASARRGYLDIIIGMVGDEEEEESEGDGPTYWDVHAKLGYQLGLRHSLSIQTLYSNDRLDAWEREIEDGYPELESWDTSYGNGYLWLHDSLILGESTLVTTVASTGKVDRDRIAATDSFTESGEIDDSREMTVSGLRQDWGLQLSPSNYLSAGFQIRLFDADYTYFKEARVRGRQPETVHFTGSFERTEMSAYVSERLRLGKALTAELGLRWQSEDLLDEDYLAPRVNLAWALGPRTVLRAGWGHVYQDQRLDELQVEDGESGFLKAEQAEHRTVGIEHAWSRRDASWSLRLDVYQRLIDDVRPRWENLFEPFQLYPELSYDRYLVAPAAAEARGAELFLARRGRGPFDWWISYAWSEVTDEINGRDVPRQLDQTHAFTFNGTWRPNERWTLNAAWIFHTGWPTTAVSGELVEQPDGSFSIVPVLGPINAEQLDDYHRLDLRLSRTFKLRRRGTLELFFDVQNLYDQKNVAGFKVDERAFSLGPSNEVIYTPNEERWLGVLPSFGIAWRF